MKTHIGLAAALLAFGACSASALDIVGFDPVLNNRFSSGFATAPVPNVSASFIGAGYDFSGVGWNPAAPQQNFAMISDRYFLYATHFAPGGSISFVSPALSTANPGNPAAAVVTYSVSATTFRAISTSLGLPGDVSVGMLTTALNPAHAISHYPLLVLPTSNDYIGQSMLIYGYSGTPLSSPRVGRNVFEGLFALDFYGDPAPDIQTFGYDSDPAPTGEASLVAGDSGGPTFIPVNGALALVGIHSEVGNVGAVPYSFDSYLPDYYPSIAAQGIPAAVVPEPSQAALAILGFGMLAAQRRRSR